MYYCFGCQEGGDSFKFIMEIEKLEFIEAIKFLAKKAGVNINLKEDKNYSKEREILLELYKRINKTFEYLLFNSKEAVKHLNYLLNRALDEDIINLFNIGFAPQNKNWLYEFLIKKGYSDKLLNKSGLFSYKNNNPYPYFSGRITFPIKNIHGEIIAFGGRRIDDFGPKYLNSPETLLFKKKDNLFGIDIAIPHIKEKKTFILVEGYMDVLALNQAGIHNCIAPLGTALNENQVKLLKRYSSNGILLLDSDEAGIKATIRSINICEKIGVNTDIIQLEKEKDPADILKKDGKDTLHKVIKYPINNFQYLINFALKKYNYKTPAGKQNIFNFFIPFFDSIDSEIKRDGYFSVLAENINVDKESISRDFYNKDKKQSKIAQKVNNNKQLSLEEYLLIAVIANHEYFTIVRNNLQLEDFKETNAKNLFIALEECFRNDIFSIDRIFEYIEDDNLKNLILEKISSNEFLLNKEKIIQDTVNKVKTRNLKLKREDITIMIKKYEKNESWKTNDLLVEKMILDKEIEELKVRNNDRTAE